MTKVSIITDLEVLLLLGLFFVVCFALVRCIDRLEKDDP